jgi:hypothetical protein
MVHPEEPKTTNRTRDKENTENSQSVKGGFWNGIYVYIVERSEFVVSRLVTGKCVSKNNSLTGIQSKSGESYAG